MLTHQDELVHLTPYLRAGYSTAQMLKLHLVNEWVGGWVGHWLVSE